MNMAHDVFVSHSVKDANVAEAIVSRLEAESIRCWVAPRDVVPGADWGESIIDAIESSRIMILVFSRHANASRQIKREVERADDKGVYTIPFRIDDIEPTKSLEYFISTAQWMNAFSPPVERHLEALAKTVAAVLAGPPPVSTAPNESNRPEIRPAAVVREQIAEQGQGRAYRPLRFWILSAVMVALLMAAGAGWYFGRTKSPSKNNVIPQGAEEPSAVGREARNAQSLGVPESTTTNVTPAAGTPLVSEPALPGESQMPSAAAADGPSEVLRPGNENFDDRGSRYQSAETPAEVVRHYYGRINERSVDQAYACLSRNFKARLSPERFSKVFLDTQTIVIRQLNEVKLGDVEGVLAITFVEMDRDNLWHDWTGNIYLVKEGDAWRIDRTALKSEHDRLRGATRP